MQMSSSSSPSNSRTKEWLRSRSSLLQDFFIRPILHRWRNLSDEAKASLWVASGIMIAITSRGIYVNCIRRIPNSEAVSHKMLHRRQWIKGVVTSVGDADNFRLYHTPGWGWKWVKIRRVPKNNKDLKDQTIHIRMAGIDAPEAAHFGRPAQPYSAEALQWLRKYIQGKNVWCQVLSRDQYGRIVAIPLIKSWFPFRYKCISLEMLKAGWATVYEQANAEYGKWGKKYFLKVLSQAQRAKRGMWVLGTEGESPSQYKKRHATNSIDHKA